MKFHLDNNIVEGTPEELVKYQELLEEKEKEEDLFKFSHTHVGYQEEEEEVEPSTDLQVGDRVKVLKSEGGAEGEAIVTAVLEDGDVRLEGKSDNGVYSYQWSNHVSNLEKIEDAPKGYTFWYIEGIRTNKFDVLKTSLAGYFEDSKGKRYTYKSVSHLIKPIDRHDTREKFERAKHDGRILKYHPTLDVFTY